MGRVGHFSESDVEGDRYRILVDAISDYAIYMLDPNGRIASWNAGAQRFKGYDAAEIIGQHFSRFYTEADRAAGAPARALETAAAEGRFEKEAWRVRKDGTHFWAHVVIDPIWDDMGKLIGFAKITRDLTERRAAEEALRRSQEQFSLLVQSVSDYAIYMLSPEGRVTSWNPGAERIKGYTAEEILGEHFSGFYTEDDRAMAMPRLALQTAEREGRFEREGWRIRKDGSRFWAHVVIDSIRGDNGELLGFAKITRDITERREAQRALEEAREALFQSQKLDAIGQLTGGVAHDFNNLLMAVLGSLELVRKRLPYDPKITPLIDNAIQGAERGAALTQRMLAFARKQELKMQAVDLPALVHGMSGLMTGSLGPSIQLEMRFPDDLPLLRTDHNQLETALLNLTVNARDAMPEGGTIRIEATADRDLDNDGVEIDYVRLVVADTGHGMDAETLARAAEPFYTTKGVGKGTGLGLSMVHGLAEQSGGRLSVQSQPGRGTAVELWLPTARLEDEQRIFDALEEDALKEDGAYDGYPLVVLAVDDDGLVLMNTVAMLEEMGHRVLPAAAASDALIALRREKVDLVITDYAMPHTTGAQLAQAIQAKHPGLPVILATGYAEAPHRAPATVTRLSKPFLQRDLSRAIRQVMASAKPVESA